MAAAAEPGPSASPGPERAPRRGWAREGAGPGAGQARREPERGSARGWKCWGVGEGPLAGAPAADIPSTPIIHSQSSPPPAAPQSGAACFLPTFEFEVCGRVEDQDLLVLRHGPRGGRHRRDSAERGRARGGGLLAGWGRWRRRLSRALRWRQLTAPAPQRLPLRGRLLGSPLVQQLGVSQLTQPHTSRPATRTAILRAPRDDCCVPTCAPPRTGAPSARPALKFSPTGRGLLRLRAPGLTAAGSTPSAVKGTGVGRGRS